MNAISKLILSFAGIGLIAACSSADNEPGPGGVSVGEARALDEAAEMIEAKRLPQPDPEAEPEAANTVEAQPQE